MANDIDRLPPHKALVAIVLMNALLWAVGYGVIQAAISIYRLARSVLP